MLQSQDAVTEQFGICTDLSPPFCRLPALTDPLVLQLRYIVTKQIPWRRVGKMSGVLGDDDDVVFNV